MTPDALELQAVAVRYGDRLALEVEALGVRSREVLGVVGPNGAGKSTLLRVLALLEAPTRGTVRFAGEVVRHDPATLLRLRRRMATVFQAPLLCDRSVYENVALGLRFRRVPGDQVRRRVNTWLDRFGIAHLARRTARTLSGGEAQRASLARACVLEPDVLFLDEPFGALDAPTRESLILDLERVLRQAGVTTVFVTHDRAEALMLADRVAVVMEGRIVQTDAPDRVFSSPATEGVARFVGADTVVPGVVRAHRESLCVIGLPGGEIQAESEAALGEAVLVCLRPEDVVLARSDDGLPATSMRNCLVGKVRRMVFVGAHARVDVDAGFELRAYVSKQSLDDLRLAVGQEVRALFKVAATHVIRRRGDGVG